VATLALLEATRPLLALLLSVELLAQVAPLQTEWLVLLKLEL
jgi:hypothetical protein